MKLIFLCLILILNSYGEVCNLGIICSLVKNRVFKNFFNDTTIENLKVPNIQEFIERLSEEVDSRVLGIIVEVEILGKNSICWTINENNDVLLFKKMIMDKMATCLKWYCVDLNQFNKVMKQVDCFNNHSCRFP